MISEKLSPEESEFTGKEKGNRNLLSTDYTSAAPRAVNLVIRLVIFRDTLWKPLIIVQKVPCRKKIAYSLVRVSSFSSYRHRLQTEARKVE